MPYQSAPSLLRRWLAGLLALMIGLGPLASPAYAALTPLADEPINIKNQAKPNIILTVDDSTSMLYDFLPDYVASNKYCRDRTGAMNTSCGYSGSPINTGRRPIRFAPVHMGTTVHALPDLRDRGRALYQPSFTRSYSRQWSRARAVI